MAMNDKPIQLALVRVFDKAKNLMVSTKVTDKQGRFNFLVEHGNYFLTVGKVGFRPYRSEIIEVKKEASLAVDVKMEKDIYIFD